MAKTTIKAQMKQRRDTKANWASSNPVLLSGELGFVSDDPNLYKMGDGVTPWNLLPFRGFDGTLAQELGTSPNAVISQKVLSEKFAEIDGKIKALEENSGSGSGSTGGSYLPLTGGTITGSLYVSGVVESRTLSVDSIIYLKGDNAYHSINARSTGDLSINSNKVLKVTTNGGMTIDGYEAIHAGNIGNYLSGGSTGGGGTVSGNYLPLTGGDINGSLNVKNILSVGVNGHSLSEQNDGSMLIQPQGNLMVIATGYDIDFTGDTFNFNGSPVVTEDSLSDLLPSEGGSVSGSYLPLTGGDITGDLSIDGVLSVGGNAIKTIDGKLCLYSNFALNILVEGEGANINGAQIIHTGNLGRYLEELGYTGGGSVSGSYLPLTGGEIDGSLNVKETLSVGVNGHSLSEQNDGSMLIQPQGNLMVIATGYDIDFTGDTFNFNGSPVVTEDSLSDLLPSEGGSSSSGESYVKVRINMAAPKYNEMEIFRDGEWQTFTKNIAAEIYEQQLPIIVQDDREESFGTDKSIQILCNCSAQLSKGLIWNNALTSSDSLYVLIWQKGSRYYNAALPNAPIKLSAITA